ncbi:exonuclease subunit SbcD [Candidatus Nitrosacidococcus tergens]|uniref:Nuclease SbcCD subunit D n=1 Tax=Candidatus Nitrosacidococcus tergens TaxID=553981 RepID=A0A7G1QA98_9GAMM|nr:exonuclease subunit SbcD [Candidatus Nitrosacidococcus tergens]CAB1276214.1 exonuclease, dsDNA, ATP-dependent [Candidatus Nitrosacidococcus tergens]
MKIIHTSDWHLGQHFMGKSREPEHQAFLAWLLEQIKIHEVNALIIAGDVFDTGTPPSYARKLYNDFIVALQPLSCQLVVIGGNHDSVATLHESRELLSYLNCLVVGGTERNLKEQVQLLHDREGNPGAILCAVPYLRPQELVTSQAGESSDDKARTLSQAIAQHYATLYDFACRKRQELGKALPIIGTGHLMVLGGESSESVRDIYIGTLAGFPAQFFPPMDYLALGHLHRGQTAGGQDHFRYSGSPIPLSFDEVKQTKQVLLLDVDLDQPIQIHSLSIPVFRKLATLKGKVSEIASQFNALIQSEVSDFSVQPCWLEVEIQDNDYLNNIQSQLQTLCEDHSIEVLRIKRQQQNIPELSSGVVKESLTELTVEEVFQRRIQLENFEDETEKEQLTQLFKEIITTLSAET